MVPYDFFYKPKKGCYNFSMKDITHKTVKKTLIFFGFAFAFACFFCGCSFFNLKEKSGTVVFSINSENYAKIIRSESSSVPATLFCDIELKGGYSETKTISITKDARVKFQSIPIGTELYAEITAYYVENNKKVVVYSGTSATIRITSGENQLDVTLKKVKAPEEQSDPNNPTDPTDPTNPTDPTETQESEDPEIKMTIYVSGTGNDTEGDGTETNPFETVDKACESIIAQGTKNTVWTIYIMGDVTGPHEGSNKAGERRYTKDYGRTLIPADLTLEHAKSILLTGYNGLDENENPKDKINRGLQEIGAGAAYTGTVLVVATKVPVTITNLLLTGSKNDSTNNSDDSYHQKGGGLHITEEATVTLSDGTLISGNDAKYGGGVYNAGRLYLIGKACIGDRSVTTVANGYVSNGKCSNEYSYGGGVYNTGKLYLGYEKYVSERENTPKELEGGIYYSYGYDAHGGGIYNTGTVVMKSGTIAYNDGAGGAGGVHIQSGSFTMTGGSIHHNSTGGNGGGVYVAAEGTFNFSSGTISANWATGDGGGIFITSSSSSAGKVFMYGNAVVGDASQTSAPTSREGANAAATMGAGIYVSGKLYMGYKSYTSESENEAAELTGGIFYNYNTNEKYNSGGGGLYISSASNGTDTNANVRMNSGTIANNSAEKGGAIYISGGSSIVLSGTASIPSGLHNKNDIYSFSYPVYVKDSLINITEENPVYITPSSDEGRTKYYSSEPVIKLASNAAIESLDEVKDKFAITPLAATATEMVTHWAIGSDGKVMQNKTNLYVASIENGGSDNNDGLSASTPLASLQAAMNKMDDISKDYIVTLNGELFGAQTISDPANGRILANSIKLSAKNTASYTDSEPKDLLNGNFGDNEPGTTLTISTAVPVTLYCIAIKGGHGTVKNRKLVGGGLLVQEGSSVSLEYYSRVINNKTSYNGSGLSGCGAGAYVSKDAKLFLNSNSFIANNTDADSGGGVYVADGGYLRIQKGSTSRIRNNAANINGGGLYLEDNAIMELYGGYIHDNTVGTNAAGTNAINGLGTGVYVSKAANLRISGAATVTIPGDVYLQDNVQIEVTDSVSGSPNLRLTPETYPAENEALYLIKINNDTSSSTLYWSGVASHFEITPQILSNGQKQYWFVDKDNNGKLSKKAGTELTVSIPSYVKNDITVSVTANGRAVDDISHIAGGTTLIFRAASGFANYTWSFDGVVQTNTQTASSTAPTVFTLDTTTLPVGAYVIYLEAKDADGEFYSYTAQVKVSAN